MEGNVKSKKRFVEVAIELGYGNDSLTFDEAVDKVTQDRSLSFESSEVIMEAFKDELDNIAPRLKTLFNERILTEKVMQVNVKKVPPGGGGIAYYVPASANGRRNGKCS